MIFYLHKYVAQEYVENNEFKALLFYRSTKNTITEEATTSLFGLQQGLKLPVL